MHNATPITPWPEQTPIELPLLRAQEVANILSISQSQAYNLIKSGEIPSVRVGHLIRVRRETLARWTEDHEGQG